jgi:hypothetical protein
MPNPQNTHVLKIMLSHTIDGHDIEKYIMTRRLRSGTNEVYEADRSGEFSADTRYGLLIVASNSEQDARAIANDLAGKFDGIIY